MLPIDAFQPSIDVMIEAIVSRTYKAGIILYYMNHVLIPWTWLTVNHVLAPNEI